MGLQIVVEGGEGSLKIFFKEGGCVGRVFRLGEAGTFKEIRNTILKRLIS